MFDFDIIDNSSDPNKDYSWDKDAVESLRQRVLDDKTLTSRTDDIFLLSFLRARKFNEDEAFKYIKRYYNVRKRFPAVFTNLIPSALQDALNVKCIGNLRHTNVDGSVILTAFCKYWDAEKASAWDLLRVYILLLDAVLTTNLLQTNGATFIFDFRESTWRHLLKLTPNFVYAAMSCLFGSYPLRYKQVHIITDSFTAGWLAVCLIPFFPKKIKERLHLHSSNLESLHKLVEKRILPSEFGGDLPPFDPSHTNKIISDNESFYQNNETYWTRKEKK